MRYHRILIAREGTRANGSITYGVYRGPFWFVAKSILYCLAIASCLELVYLGFWVANRYWWVTVLLGFVGFPTLVIVVRRHYHHG